MSLEDQDILLLLEHTNSAYDDLPEEGEEGPALLPEGDLQGCHRSGKSPHKYLF